MPERDAEELLRPGEVAALFRVDPKTVTRWANAGKLEAIHTLGGHRRYRAAQIHSLLARSAPGAPGGGDLDSGLPGDAPGPTPDM